MKDLREHDIVVVIRERDPYYGCVGPVSTVDNSDNTVQIYVPDRGYVWWYNRDCVSFYYRPDVAWGGPQ